MNEMIKMLDDNTLLSAMRRIAGNIRREQVLGLKHLAEIDARKLYLPLGFSSLWSYCRDELKLSEGTTSRWRAVARAAYRFPQVYDYVADGRLSVCAVAVLS